MHKKQTYFDSSFPVMEQLPRKFTTIFETVDISETKKTRVSINNLQIGDLIDDNTSQTDHYRFHDVFHYTFATLLAWSPCARALMKRKRKSNPQIDKIEDGARATITEESISLMIFSKAKKLNNYENQFEVDSTLLNTITEMTANFEVCIRTKQEWEKAILLGYDLFRKLIKNDGGKIHFDMSKREAKYELN